MRALAFLFTRPETHRPYELLRPAIVLATAGSLAVLAACADRAPTPPVSAATAFDQGPSTTAGQPIVLLNSPKAFAAALSVPDSSGLVTDLGSITYDGQAGDSVSLIFEADPRVRDAIPPGAVLIVSSADDTLRLTLAALHASIVHRMNADGPITLRFALSRTFVKTILLGGARLAAVATSSPVISARLPFTPATFQSSGLLASLSSPAPPCTAIAPGTWCGITVGIAPYAPGAPFGDFQSQAGTGASTTITITFSPPVRFVTVTIQDPTWPGNAMAAYSATGTEVGSAGFPGSGVAGVNVPRTATITAPGITRVMLTPASDDYVAYNGLTFALDTTCQLFTHPADVTDSLLNDPFVQQVMRTLADSAGWGKPLSEQAERGLFVMRHTSTATDTVIPYDNQIADRSGTLYTLPPGPCLSSTSLHDVITLAQHGYTPVLQVHVHPKHGPQELPVSNCYNPAPNHDPPYAAREPDPLSGVLLMPSGPSRIDTRPWHQGPDSPQYPGYVIEPGRMYQWDAPVTNNFKFVQHSWELQRCVGGGS
ncbi:MAG TPA: hypothetical protein VMV51_12960 [Gemmatimonadaceae bacterium]|nr:hypothetical protein [Gemmatimonadaceae bacterium]